MLPQLVDIHQDYRQRAFDPADSNDDSPLTPPATLDVNNPYSYNAKDQPQFMYNPPRDEYSPSPVDNQYYANYPPYYNNQPRRPAVYHHLDPINTSALPVPLEHPDQLSPFNPNFSASLSAPYTYSPVSPDDHYGPSPPNTGTSSASAPVTLTLSQAPATSQPLLLHHHSSSLGPSPTESNSKTYSFIPLPGNAVKKRPRRRYDEIERLYQCSWPDCSKSYGTLNHLNAHVTMQKHGSKRSPNEFKELRKQWRKAKKEAEHQAHQAASAHSLAARRVASMQSLSTAGLSPLNTELRRTHTQEHLYEMQYLGSPINATHLDLRHDIRDMRDMRHDMRNAYPSSAPSSTAGGPLAFTQMGGTPPTSAHPLDSPHHYSNPLPNHQSHPGLSMLHSAAPIPIAHHHPHHPHHSLSHQTQSHHIPGHMTSDGRYPLGLQLADFAEASNSNNLNGHGPSSNDASPRSVAADLNGMDGFIGRQRYGSAPSILWSSARSTYVSSVPTNNNGDSAYGEEGGERQEYAVSQQRHDNGDGQMNLNFNGMVAGMNMNLIGNVDGHRLPADSTLLTPLRGYEPPNLLPPFSSSQQSQPSQYSGQEEINLGGPEMLNVGGGDNSETRPSSGHDSLRSVNEDVY
ncbi:hypothetical protein BDN71DRAFT_1505158 [Pleurotus eryngii]|uniref:C2H2-type domain-containing protein n=1 Tax=Pleurotus eryngii TaxID=5323 RepID=A0A9P6DGV1_PLEER|nr:hypothetical protein BDN71DRAFT_1505158 [Pleurotus eryngii]